MEISKNLPYNAKPVSSNDIHHVAGAIKFYDKDKVKAELIRGTTPEKLMRALNARQTLKKE